MFKCINGWTKAKMLKVLRARRYNFAAMDESGRCVYLTKNGNKCAVGMFIPDGHEAQKSNLAVTSVIEKYNNLTSIMPLSTVAMQEFQQVHDALSNQKNAKQAMIDWIKENVS